MNFQKNQNGKFTCQNFCTMQPFNQENYLGAEHKLSMQGSPAGTAKVYALTEVSVANITDAMAWLDAGMALAPYKTMLSRMYGGATKFHFIVYHWTCRDIQVHANIIAAHWQTLLQEVAEQTNYEYLAK